MPTGKFYITAIFSILFQRNKIFELNKVSIFKTPPTKLVMFEKLEFLIVN